MDATGYSDLEKEREARIARNRAQFEALGLGSAIGNFRAQCTALNLPANQDKQKKDKKKKQRRGKQKVPAGRGMSEHTRSAKAATARGADAGATPPPNAGKAFQWSEQIVKMANEVEVDLNSSAGAILRAMCAWAAPHTLVITDKELLKSMFTACRGLEASYFTASMLSDPAHAAVVAGMLADNDTKQELEKAGVPAGLRSRIVFTLTALASMQSTPPPTVSSKRSGTTAAGAAAGVDRKRSCQALIDTLRSTLGQPVLKDAGSKADVLKALEEPDNKVLLDTIMEHSGGASQVAKALRLAPEASPGTVKRQIKTVATTLWRNRTRWVIVGAAAPAEEEEVPAEPPTPRWTFILDKDDMERYNGAPNHMDYMLTFDLDTHGVVLVGAKPGKPTEAIVMGMGLLTKKLNNKIKPGDLVEVKLLRKTSGTAKKAYFPAPVLPVDLSTDVKAYTEVRWPVIGLLPTWNNMRAVGYAVHSLGLEELCIESMRLLINEKRKETGEYYVDP